MLTDVLRRRALDWLLPLFLGALSAMVLAAGFYLALTARFGDRLGPPPAVAADRGWGEGSYRVVALGDSISAGVGDTPERGYVERVVEELRDSRSVRLANLAEPGDETEELLELLQEPAILERVAAAHLILVSIGGNDLTHGMRRAGEREDDPAAPAQAPLPRAPTAQEDDVIPDSAEALEKASANLVAIVKKLRETNPKAAIRILGLYNPFEVLPSAEPKIRARLFEWNAAIEKATHPYRDVIAVPIADLFINRPGRLAGDRFHPGPDGHDEIADRVFQTLPQDD